MELIALVVYETCVYIVCETLQYLLPMQLSWLLSVTISMWLGISYYKHYYFPTNRLDWKVGIQGLPFSDQIVALILVFGMPAGCFVGIIFQNNLGVQFLGVAIPFLAAVLLQFMAPKEEPIEIIEYDQKIPPQIVFYASKQKAIAYMIFWGICMAAPAILGYFIFKASGFHWSFLLITLLFALFAFQFRRVYHQYKLAKYPVISAHVLGISFTSATHGYCEVPWHDCKGLTWINYRHQKSVIITNFNDEAIEIDVSSLSTSPNHVYTIIGNYYDEHITQPNPPEEHN